jgi:8-oxo-dGTP diphosphatase
MLYEPESDEEREFLFSYKARAVQYPRTEVTVDAVVLWRAGVGDDWDVLLIKRKGWPYKGMWALPGGFLDQNETALEGVLRELKEETGLDAVVWDVVQMPVADEPTRDPRARVIAIPFVFWRTEPKRPGTKPGDDASEVKWANEFEAIDLAFDHGSLLTYAIEHVGDIVH